MKKMKKMSLIVSVMMIIAMLTGCAGKFDAAHYVQGVLDNSYKNDSSIYVEQKIASAEEAEKVYNEGIEKELTALTTGAGSSMSDELKEEYRKFLQELFAAADYTVKDAKNVDGNYIVTVEYKKLNVFADAMTAYQEEVAKMDQSSYESQDELYNAVYQILLDSLNTSLANKNYGETESTTITVSAANKVYTPLATDLEKFEKALFDLDGLQ